MNPVSLLLAAALSLMPGRVPLQIALGNTTVAVPIIGSAGIAAAQGSLSWTAGLQLDSIRPNQRWFVIVNDQNPCGVRCVLWAGFDLDGIPEQGTFAIAYFRTANRTQCDVVAIGPQKIGVQLGDEIFEFTSGISTRPLVLCTVRR